MTIYTGEEPSGKGELQKLEGASHHAEGVETEKEKTSNTRVQEADPPVWDDQDEVPALHFRTWIALAAMFILNLVQLVALQGPPAVVSVPFSSLARALSFSGWLTLAVAARS